MARGHVGIVIGIQSGFRTLCDMWGRRAQIINAQVEDGRSHLHHSEYEIIELIKKLITFKRMCDQSGTPVYFALPNSDQMGMLSQFFQFLGEPLKNKEIVRIEAIQNFPIKTLVFAPLDVSPSRLVEQLARMTLLCPKVDHIVLSKATSWTQKSLLALQESWEWIQPLDSETWGTLTKEITGRSPEETTSESKSDPITATRNMLMKKLIESIDKLAPTEKPILIAGEEGVGKELVINRIHALSSHPQLELKMVDCAAVDVAIIEHVGAHAEGTLVLRNFDKLSVENEEHVLNYITAEENMIPGRKIVLEVQNISEERELPYEKLGAGVIEVPPLRMRKEDIEILVSHFVHKFNIEKRRKVSGVSRRALRALAGYEWPGNVRELEQVIERAMLMKTAGMIDVCDFPEKYIQKILSEIEYEDILRGPNKRLAVPQNNLRKEACYDQKHGGDFRMSNNSFFKGQIDQAVGHTCHGGCQHEQESSFVTKEGGTGMQKMEEFLDMIQSTFKCTDEGVDFNTIVDRFENILILAALARTGWNRNRAAALLKLNRTTLVEKLKKKQLSQPGMSTAPTATVTTTTSTVGF